MRRKLAILLALLAVVSFFPSFSEIFTCRYCIWTTINGQGGGLYSKEWSLGKVPEGYYFYGNVWGFWTGRNDKEINEEEIKGKEIPGFWKDYRWHRVRLGIPLQSITIDKMDNLNDWHMNFEGWFWFNLAFWLALWFLYQFVVFVAKHLKRG